MTMMIISTKHFVMNGHYFKLKYSSLNELFIKCFMFYLKFFCNRIKLKVTFFFVDSNTVQYLTWSWLKNFMQLYQPLNVNLIYSRKVLICSLRNKFLVFLGKIFLQYFNFNPDDYIMVHWLVDYFTKYLRRKIVKCRKHLLHFINYNTRLPRMYNSELFFLHD